MSIVVGSSALADWLSGNSTNVFGNVFTSTTVADFYRNELFKQKSTKSAGAAFGTSDGANLTVMQLLLGTNHLTDRPNEILDAARIYDINGDGVIDAYETSLRIMANDVYSAINDGGGI